MAELALAVGIANDLPPLARVESVVLYERAHGDHRHDVQTFDF